MELQSSGTDRVCGLAADGQHHAVGGHERAIPAVRDDADPGLGAIAAESARTPVRRGGGGDCLVARGEHIAAVGAAARVYVCHVDSEAPGGQPDQFQFGYRPGPAVLVWKLPVVDVFASELPGGASSAGGLSCGEWTAV